MVLAALITAVVFALGQAGAHLRTDEADSWLFAYYGDRLLEGARLYGDLWDNKPPGIFWINAAGLWFGGGRYGAVIALCVLASAASLLLFYRAARGWFGSTPALLGLMFAGLYLSHQTYRGGTNRPETFVVLFDLAVVYFYQRGIASNRTRFYLLAGVMAGVSLCFKQTGVSALVAVVMHGLFVIVRTRRFALADFKPLLLIAGGLLGAVAAAVAGLVWTGDLWWAWDAVVMFVWRFGAARSGVIPRIEWFGIAEHIHMLGLPLVLACGGLAFAAISRFRRVADGADGATETHPAGIVLLLVTWFAVAVFVMFSGPNRAFHYAPPALTPLLLLATYAVGILIQQRADHRHFSPYAFRYVAVAWMCYMAVEPLRFQIHQFNMGLYLHSEQADGYEDRTVVEFIERHTEPGDRIFLWSYLPHVYWATRRRCGARFHSMLNAKQLKSSGQYMVDDILRSFQADPPQLVTISMRRAQELRDGEVAGYLDYRALAAFLCQRYQPLDPDNPDSTLVLAKPTADGR